MTSPLQEIVVLLPCHSLEDFPTYHQGNEAASLLATYTAAWHPALLHAAGRLPNWHRADMLPAELEGRLLVVPPSSESWLPSDFVERTSEALAVVRGHEDRPALVNQLLEAAQVPPLELNADTQADTVADFFALGFCRLMVELLTRVMRYTTTIDETRLQADSLAAIEAALAHDTIEQEACLRRAFDLLCESRRYFFPVDPYLIDLTLVAGTTLGASLRHELAQPSPSNLLLCARDLELLAETEPASLAQLTDALQAGIACVVGGDYNEDALPLLPLEICREQILQGLAVYERILSCRPVVYARRRAGLTPWLPQLLCRTGFQAALHFTLDEGQFPTAYNGKVRWETPDGSVVEALAQVPHDANKPDPFIGLPRALGEAMDRDSAAVLVFAHWPGQVCPWYDDLRRGARFAPAVGQFVALDKYFQTTAGDAPTAEFRADEYRTPHLRQTVHHGGHDAISQWSQRQQTHAAASAAATSQLLKSVVLPNGTAESSAAATRRLAINPHTFAWQASDGDHAVQVPGLGFAKFPIATSGKRVKKQSTDAVADGHTLRNEFCEVVLSESTGGIQSLHDLRTRGNRISQQLAMRLPADPATASATWRDPDVTAEYSRMLVDEMAVTSAGPAVAEITSRGKLLAADDELLANFTQHTRLAAGSQLVELRIELDVKREPIGDPWLCYYCVRWALPDTEAAWYQAMGFRREPVFGRRFESPTLVEVESLRWRTAILTTGLPFHRRTAKRMIDTLLVVPGESARQFTVAVGIDLNQPFAAQAALLAPPVTVDLPADSPLPDHGWLFHVAAKNVLATAFESLPPNGFVARLHETAGSAGKICVQCYKPITTARLCDFLGGTLCELPVEHDKLWLELRPFEWTQLEVQFA
jgi:alpha-mannosidase